MARPSVREKIVETAVGEFHRNGYNACSVDTITKAAGVPKGSFYNHFKSKEELGAEAVARYTEKSEWTSDGTLPALVTLQGWFQDQRDVIVANGYTRGCLIGNMGEEAADHSEPIRAQVQASLGGWSDTIAGSIRAAQAEGTVSAELDAGQLGSYILNAWEGTILRAKVVKNPDPFDAFFAAVFDIVLR
jgi:TetR/AcrR family transcriptional repressor of nem operon